MFDGWWITDWLNHPSGRGAAFVFAQVVWVIGSITLHELAHGWAALAKGDPTPRATGHMTWNPLVHMGQTSLIIFALFGIAWGAMPVDPSRMRGRWAEIFVLAAGPAMNLALAVVAGVGAVLWLGLAGNIPEPLRTNVHIFLMLGAGLNLVLLLLNLLPVPPLDGGRIAMDLVPAYRRAMTSENGQWIALGAFILVFFVGGRYIFGVAWFVSSVSIHLGGAALDAATGMGIPVDVLPI